MLISMSIQQTSKCDQLSPLITTKISIKLKNVPIGQKLRKRSNQLCMRYEIGKLSYELKYIKD